LGDGTPIFVRRSNPTAAARAWTMRATVPALMTATPTRGRGVPAVPAAQRDPDPPEHRPLSVIPGYLLPLPQRTHRAEICGAAGDGDAVASAGALALAVRRGQARAALARLEMLDADGGEFRAVQRAGEADQQQRTIAQAGRVGFYRGQDPAQDPGGGGGHGTAGDDMQIAAFRCFGGTTGVASLSKGVFYKSTRCF